MNTKHSVWLISVILFFLMAPCMLFGSNGYFLTGAGAVNESLGGAATAGNTSDVIGSLYRNPSNATLFDGRMAAFSLEALLPNVSVRGAVPGLDNSTDSDVDVIPIANLGMVFRDQGAPMASYFGIIAEAGLSLEFPSNGFDSNANPLLLPQALGGFGSVKTELQVVRIPIGFSHDVNEKFSAGFAIGPTLARMRFTPAAFAAPDDANGDAVYSYPDDISHAVALGMGFQAGVRYKVTDAMNIGATLTSPTWFEQFEWETEDENGQKRVVTFRLNRPLTANAGLNYLFPTQTLVLLDVSWINFSNADGFDDTGFAADGSLKGLGFDDIFVVALGIQQKIGSALTLRGGYNYCENPIDEKFTFFNVGSPLHSEQHLSLGLSYALSETAVLDFGYTHAFKSSQTGPIYLPAGEVPGSEIETELSYDHIAVGVTMSF